jgi:GxxExxY protein
MEHITTDKTFLYNELTDKIIHSFYEVYNYLGFGFLEKIYEKSLKTELISSGLNVKSQEPIKVYYKNDLVGDFFADLIVNNKIIIEIKAVEILIKEHEFQLMNYLKATEYQVGLLLNFGKKPEIRRKIYTNDLKNFPKNL